MEKRNFQVNVRFSKDQFDELSAAATVNNMKPTEFIRWLVTLQVKSLTTKESA